jgi:LysM repeat protein
LSYSYEVIVSFGPNKWVMAVIGEGMKARQLRLANDKSSDDENISQQIPRHGPKWPNQLEIGDKSARPPVRSSNNEWAVSREQTQYSEGQSEERASHGPTLAPAPAPARREQAVRAEWHIP